MAVDMFLKISGIDGESTDDKHKGEIDILSFSWGVTNAVRGAATPGQLSAARKSTISDFSIVKYLDRSSPSLFVKCCSGEHIPEVSFSARKAGESQQEYLKIKLSDVLISSVSPSGAVGGNADALEQVSFSFTAAEISAADSRGNFSTTAACGGSTFPGDVEVIGKTK